MWNDSNDTIMEIYDEACEGRTIFPSNCPICQNKQAHLYMHRHDSRHGGVWMWCSSCKAYAHMSGIIPDWWQNPDFIDGTVLDSEPTFLDTITPLIDPWVNNLIDSRKPLASSSSERSES